MKVDKTSLLLYAVTDRTWLGENLLEDQVEDILKSGATFLQLREKEMDSGTFLAEARSIKEIAGRFSVPFVIDDNIGVALAADADGVHIGQSDGSVADARARIGKNKILGVSAQTVEQALRAEKEGADYLGVGAVFSTSTKSDADDVPYEMLRAICEAVRIPVVAIGGINEKNILRLRGSGIAGVAVISAIFASPDVSAATRRLHALAGELVK